MRRPTILELKLGLACTVLALNILCRAYPGALAVSIEPHMTRNVSVIFYFVSQNSTPTRESTGTS
jgi:hypothetical protein